MAEKKSKQRRTKAPKPEPAWTDERNAALRAAVERAKLGRREKLEALRRLVAV